MNNKALSVHEVAELTGITNRTLHYYDEIGLLKPSIVTEAKYRLYTNDDLARLQEILFYREVGFALKEISTLMAAEMYTREEALKRQIQILEAKKERIGALIELVEGRIAGKQEITFEAFSKSKIIELQAKFRSEIIERWGNSKYYEEFEKVFSKKTQKIQQEIWLDFLSWSQVFFEKLSEYKNPGCSDVQDMVMEWQEYISEHFYKCDNQLLSYLGELYISDERFSNYINRFGKNSLANFFNEAIKIFCSGSNK